MTSVVKGAFTANKDAGTGNDTVQIVAPSNDSGAQRTGTFVIKNGDGTKQITILCNQNVETSAITEIVYTLRYKLDIKHLTGTVVCTDQNGNLANSPISITLYAVYTNANGKIKYAFPISILANSNNFTIDEDNFLQNADIEGGVEGEVLLTFNNTADADPVETYTDDGIDYSSIATITE